MMMEIFVRKFGMMEDQWWRGEKGISNDLITVSWGIKKTRI